MRTSPSPAALLVALLLAMLPAPAGAQQPGAVAIVALDTAALPRDVAARAMAMHEAAEIRARGSVSIDSARVVKGVSVQDGSLVIAGRVDGHVLALNTDVQLRPGARVEGDLLVIGGDLTGVEDASVTGELRQYRSLPRVARDDEDRTRDRDRNRGRARDEDSDRWWNRWERRREGRSWTDFHISSAGAYNRVEGLPVKLGPRVRQALGEAQLLVDAFTVVRTASSFRDDSSDVGYDLLTELRSGQRNGFALGGRLYDVNAPVESWQLSELEAGLASFLARRDYRDYFGRHGGQVIARAYMGPNVSLEARYGDERWRARSLENPFTLFNAGRNWRPNPFVDEGRFHVVNSTLNVDTRNDEDNPWSGWYVMADVERGAGRLTTAAPLAVEVRGAPAPGDLLEYTRGLVDLRRYNRLGPAAQLNLRVVAGGWLAGDPLPVQRRLSVDGPGALPGFGFRRQREGFDVGTCNTSTQRVGGQPALCERIALVQVEYRNDLYVSSVGDWGWVDVDGDAEWVMFADAGRGWLLRDAAGGSGYGRGELPPLDSFRADVGFGLDFSQLGVYVAKSVTAGAEPPVFFVRVRHRF